MNFNKLDLSLLHFNSNLKKQISITILLLISFIFTDKYSPRITDYSILISFSILALQFSAYKFGNKIVLSTKKKSIILVSSIILLVTVSLFVFLKIPVETLNIDRYSVINSFIDEALKGNYPYYAKSAQGNTPGPMPFYFLIAFPFYLIGEYSLLSVLGYVLFIFLVLRKIKEYQNINFFILYLLTSSYVYWEIATRSNIFTISVFIVFLMDYFLRIPHEKKIKLYAFGLIAGLLLSTRSVYSIVYIVFFLSGLINRELKFRQLIYIGIFILIGFIITFLPIFIFFMHDFLIINPFIIQSSSLVPPVFIYPFLLTSLLLTFFARDNQDKFFISGLSLFISILLYAIYEIYQNGIHEAIYGNCIDISYFLFCVPFFIYYLMNSDLKEDNKLSV